MLLLRSNPLAFACKSDIIQYSRLKAKNQIWLTNVVSIFFLIILIYTPSTDPKGERTESLSVYSFTLFKLVLTIVSI